MSDQDDEVPSTRVLEPIWVHLDDYQRMLEEHVDYHRGRAAVWEALFWGSSALNAGAMVAIILMLVTGR